jgi:predicted nucleic acid-binding protein
MNVVVDASVVLKCVITEEDSAAALRMLANHDIAAPDFVLIECRNALLAKLRRQELQRIEAEEGQSALDQIALAITILATVPMLRQAYAIALDLAHPIYDCIYLATALATDRKLVTADVQFATKATRLRSAENRIALLHSLST